MSRLCPHCNERELEDGALKCAPCKLANKIARMKRSNAAAKAKRDALPPRPPKSRPCKCGCGKHAISPAMYATDACKAKGREASRVKWNATRKKPQKEAVKPRTNHPERFGLKPHRPDPPPQRKPIISEEEQARLDAEASRRDREWNKRFFKETLGLESPAPGKPLASKVVTPPPEVFQMYQEQYRPQQNVEREFHIPLRADISYN